MAIVGLNLPIKALQLGAGFRVVFLMLVNLFVDWLIGLVPLAGDILDVGFRCHQRNAGLLREALEQR